MAFIGKLNISRTWSSVLVIKVSIISYLNEDCKVNTYFTSSFFAISTDCCSCCWSELNSWFTNVTRFNCACTVSSVPVNCVTIIARFNCGCDRVSSDRRTTCWSRTTERSSSSISSQACSGCRIRVYRSSSASSCSSTWKESGGTINSGSRCWVRLILSRST